MDMTQEILSKCRILAKSLRVLFFINYITGTPSFTLGYRIGFELYDAFARASESYPLLLAPLFFGAFDSLEQ